MKQGIVPRPRIDADARWVIVIPTRKGFGYKLYTSKTTGDLIAPLTTNVTTAYV